ncbi:MAG: DASS family sodium-coupled anion symporter [Gemmatimonadota bacterium]|nr:DASS family sodium-coupled anion symporter [Gemmatimonadota bacterium]
MPERRLDDAETGGLPTSYGMRQLSGWILGPGALFATLLLPAPAGLSEPGWHTAGAAMLMAVWWITESVPIPVTALVPLVLFPALGLGDIRETAAPFANPIIYLFFGGFIIALAMQKWGLHRRVAINLIGVMGTRPSRIVAGFLLSSALISMWVSNTATALMMLPIAMSVVHLLPDGGSRAQRQFGTALLLSVAYGATTGGMATLIGTPPNALLAAYVENTYGLTLGFGQWMLLGVPIMLVTLPVVHLVLARVVFQLDKGELPGMRDLITEEKGQLGPLSRGEKIVMAVFALTTTGWVLQPLIARTLPLVSDTTIAMTGALLLFFTPVDWRRGQFTMDWESTRNLPWEVLLLFGGGLSLAANIEKHGLSVYLGSLTGSLDGLPMLALLCVVCFGILMLTELTSNTATAATFLPITAAIAISLGQNPLLFLIPTALAANCSYMMPVGTPPNAIVFGSGRVPLPQMARAGMLLNIALVPIIIGLVLLIAPLVFGVQIGQMPEWVKR